MSCFQYLGGSIEYFHGPRHALLWLYRHNGIRGVYRGYTVFVMRDVPASGIYITVYQFLYDYLYTTRLCIAHVICRPNFDRTRQTYTVILAHSDVSLKKDGIVVLVFLDNLMFNNDTILL